MSTNTGEIINFLLPVCSGRAPPPLCAIAHPPGAVLSLPPRAQVDRPLDRHGQRQPPLPPPAAGSHPLPHHGTWWVQRLGPCRGFSQKQFRGWLRGTCLFVPSGPCPPAAGPASPMCPCFASLSEHAPAPHQAPSASCCTCWCEATGASRPRQRPSRGLVRGCRSCTVKASLSTEANCPEP